jgi:hypothetical protein
MYDKRTDIYTLMPLNEQSGTEYLDYREGTKNVNTAMYGEGSLSWNNKFADKHEVSMMTVFTIRDYLAANAGDLQKSLPTRNVNLAGALLTLTIRGIFLNLISDTTAPNVLPQKNVLDSSLRAGSDGLSLTNLFSPTI